jgi:hypothetical protein
MAFDSHKRLRNLGELFFASVQAIMDSVNLAHAVLLQE